MDVIRNKLPDIPQKWNTINNNSRSHTYSYFRVDEVMSAFQKSIRRRIITIGNGDVLDWNFLSQENLGK